MCKCFLAILFWGMLYAANSFAQSVVINIKSAKEIDSIRNNTHFKIAKLTDSIWRAAEYDSNDTIMNIGTYKDEKLRIRDGKFKIYYCVQPTKQIRYDYTNHKADTVIVPTKNFLSMVAYFSNGKKTGTWYEYNVDGKLSLTQTFDNDKLNGLYQKYNPETGKILVRGNYVDDLREGDWNMLSYNGDVMNTEIYKKGKYIKEISHLNEKKFEQKQTGGAPKYDLINYLNRTLANKRFDAPAGTKTVLYSLTEDIDGKLIEPSALTRSSLAIDTVVIDALLAAPKWQPAYINGELTRLSIPFNFEIIIADDKHIRIAVKQYGRQANGAN